MFVDWPFDSGLQIIVNSSYHTINFSVKKKIAAKNQRPYKAELLEHA